MLFAGLLMLSVGFTAPAWGKGHSPPGKETIKAPELIQAYVAIPVIEVNTDQTKTIAGVYTATNETTKEYASHITSVAFVPLYRWQEQIFAIQKQKKK